MVRAKWALILQARLIRGLGYVTSLFLRLLGERRAPATFSRKISTTISPGANIVLHFYTPENYYESRGKTAFPTIVDFHGGGFCLGGPTDDAAWCNRLVQDLNAVVISVGYRLAPEYPFPTAVQDGVDALRYLTVNATELGIDVERIATSGFSAGGNLSITVPLMFHQLQEENDSPTPSEKVRIKSMVAWYPSTDFTRSREQRAATMVRPDKQLPPFLTRLFDDGYIPEGTDRTSPYLSPLVASDEVLAHLPTSFILYTCEWDMLEKEGTEFAHRFQKKIGGNVRATMVKGVRHGWDKMPGANPAPDGFYKEACMLLKRAFDGEDISRL